MNTVSTIYINGREAENSLKGLTSLAARLAAELKRAELGSEAFAAKAEEWRKVQAVIDDQKDSLKEYIDTYGKTAPAERSLTRLREKHTELVKQLDELEVGTKEWLAQLSKVKDSEDNLNRINEQIKGADNSAGGFGNTLVKVGGVMAGAFAIDTVVTFVDELRKTAIMLDTYQNKTATVFGEATQIVEESATKQSADIGLARSQYKLLATDIGDLLVPMGFQREEAARVSTSLVDLSGVLAEWSGGQKTATEVSGSLRKALMGEYEELENVGIKLSEDIVKTKLAADGKDKLKGAALEQAKAQAVLSLIMEKSQDAQTAFAQNQDSLARQSARLSASFQTIKETLAQSLIPVFASATSAVASLITKSSDMGSQMKQESIEVGGLVNRIVSYNEGNELRNDLIKELQEKYPDFLKNLNAEKVTNEQLKDRLQEVNQQYAAKIMAAEVSKTVEEAQKRETKAVDESSKASVRAAKGLAEAQQLLGDARLSGLEARDLLQKKFQEASWFSSEKEKIRDLIGTLTFYQNVSGNTTQYTSVFTDAVKKAADERQRIIEILKKQNPEIAAQLDILSGKTNTPTPNKPTPNTPTSDKKDKNNDLEKQRDALDRLREQQKAFINDIAQLNANGDKAEEIRIREKYEKQIEAASELLKSKYPSVVKEANEILAQLNAQSDEEILALQAKHLREVEDNLKLHQTDVAAAAISDDEKALQRIRDRYAKEITEAVALEESKSQTIAQKATETRVALQQTLEAELQIERDRQEAAQDQRDIENYDKDLQKRLLREQEYNEFTNNLQQQEIDQLEVQYLTILGAAEKEGRDVTAVTDAYLKRRQGIIDKYNKERVDKERQTTQTLKQAEVDLKLARLGAMEQGVSALRGMLGETSALSKALFAFEKGLAIAQIFVNLQKEKSAIAARNALIPPPAGPALTATEIAIASTRAGIGAAIIGAQAVANFTAPQKYMGGYHQVKGKDDGRTYNARYIGQPQTGMLPESPSLVLASERGREYFVSNEALARPDVAWHVQAIDNLVQNRTVRQFAEGGFTQNSPPNTPDDAPPKQSESSLMLSVLEKILEVFSKPIEADAVIGYAKIKEIKDGIERLNRNEN